MKEGEITNAYCRECSKDTPDLLTEQIVHRSIQVFDSADFYYDEYGREIYDPIEILYAQILNCTGCDSVNYRLYCMPSPTEPYEIPFSEIAKTEIIDPINIYEQANENYLKKTELRHLKRQYCAKQKSKFNHEVLDMARSQDGKFCYQIIKCKSCGNIGFRTIEHEGSEFKVITYRKRRNLNSNSYLYDEFIVNDAEFMSEYFMELYCIENTIRKILKDRLIKEYEESWWEKGIPENLRKEVDKKILEEQNKTLLEKTDDRLNYTTTGELINIFEYNSRIFNELESNKNNLKTFLTHLSKVRNVIAHNRKYSKNDTVLFKHIKKLINDGLIETMKLEN